jgi:hypothetical protein
VETRETESPGIPGCPSSRKDGGARGNDMMNVILDRRLIPYKRCHHPRESTAANQPPDDAFSEALWVYYFADFRMGILSWLDHIVLSSGIFISP